MLKLRWVILYSPAKVPGAKKKSLDVCLLCVPNPFKLWDAHELSEGKLYVNKFVLEFDRIFRRTANTCTALAGEPRGL